MRTVLLDLDGTLVDSAALITTHLAAAIAAVGAPVPGPDVLRTLVGPPFETALPALGLTDAQVVAAVVRYRASYEEVAATHTPLYPGVSELLEKLDADGFRLAMATSKPETTARKIAAGVGIGDRFALVGGADPLTGRVGKAAVVGSVLQRLALDPLRDPVVMVGDRHHDVDGAAEHGIRTIGVGWGYAEPGELAGALRVVGDLDALRDVLGSDPTIWSA